MKKKKEVRTYIDFFLAQETLRNWRQSEMNLPKPDFANGFFHGMTTAMWVLNLLPKKKAVK